MGTPTHKLWPRVHESTDWVKLRITSKQQMDGLMLICPPDVELRSTPVPTQHGRRYLIEARSLR